MNKLISVCGDFFWGTICMYIFAFIVIKAFVSCVLFLVNGFVIFSFMITINI